MRNRMAHALLHYPERDKLQTTGKTTTHPRNPPHLARRKRFSFIG
jgi:hypothetical protein